MLIFLSNRLSDEWILSWLVFASQYSKRKKMQKNLLQSRKRNKIGDLGMKKILKKLNLEVLLMPIFTPLAVGAAFLGGFIFGVMI